MAERPDCTLHFEYFAARGAGLDPEKETAFDVELTDSNLTLRVAADRTLLETVEAAGIDLASDCCEGLCGSCEVPQAFDPALPTGWLACFDGPVFKSYPD